jgi:Uma2 family endonuclease
MFALSFEEPLSVADFLGWVDAHPETAWELFDGVPVAMARGTLRHALVGGNIAFAVEAAARRKGCRVLRDMFLRAAFDPVSGRANVFDPDVMVRCGPMGDLVARTVETADIVFEVLSPSTWSRDRGVKANRYMGMLGLLQLVLVYPGEVRLESWVREPGGEWPEEPEVLTRHADTLLLAGLGEGLTLGVVYEGVG